MSLEKMKYINNRWVQFVAILLLLSGNAMFCLWRFGPKTGDSDLYLRLGSNLAIGHGFSRADHSPYQPEVFRSPFYPIFLSLLFRLGFSIFGIVMIQIGLYLMAIWIAMDILRAVEPEGKGIFLLGIILACHAPMIHWMSSITTEALCTTLFAGSCWLLLAHLRSPSLYTLVGLGITLVLLFFTRAEYIVLMPVVVVICFSKYHSSSHLFGFFFFVLLLVLPIGAWVYRNVTIMPGYSRFIGVGSGMTLWIRAIELQESNNSERTARLAHKSFQTIHSSLDPIAIAEADKCLEHEALNVISDNPIKFILDAPIKCFWREWVEVYSPKLPRIVLVLATLISTSLLLGSYVGIVLLRRRWQIVIPLVACCFAVAATHCIGGTEARYTSPVRPVLYVFAAIAIVRVYSMVTREGSRNFQPKRANQEESKQCPKEVK